MRQTVWLGFGLIVLTAACAGAGVGVTVSKPAAPKAESPPRTVPIAEAHAGSTVALARVDGRSLAFVADEDDADIHAVDVDTRAELSTTALGGVPGQLLVVPDGRVVVALRDRAQVAIFQVASKETGALRWLGSFTTPAEPVGLALTPDDATLLVTSGWDHALSAYRMSDRSRAYVVALPREPRSVVVSDDGKKAFVAHVVGGKLTVVDLTDASHPVRELDMVAKVKEAKDPPALPSAQFGLDERSARFNPFGESDKEHERTACQGFALAKSTDPAGRILAPEVLVDPGDGTERSVGYGSAFRPTEVGNVAVIDVESAQPLEASLRVPERQGLGQSFAFVGKRGLPGPQDCLLPRAAAYDKNARALFVACFGVDSVVEYDGASADPHSAERRRWHVASGPTGIAVDADKRRLLVWSQFDRALNFLPYDDASLALGEQSSDGPPPHMMLSLSRKPATTTADLAEGRKLFHAAGDRRISADGRACASCHPDGRDDALTWVTPDGPRNTPMLAGRVEGTAPYGWLGANDDVKRHLTQTFQRLRGGGFEERQLTALMAYVSTLRPPVSTPEPVVREALAKRGETIFKSLGAGCSGCHAPETGFTDAMKHDVASATKTESAHEFDTPSLRFVAGTAPYFHDGRYATLQDLLVASDGKMGHTSQLAPEELDALEAYLRTL